MNGRVAQVLSTWSCSPLTSIAPVASSRFTISGGRRRTLPRAATQYSSFRSRTAAASGPASGALTSNTTWVTP